MLLLVQFIKVQIRRDLALDVSAATGDTSLAALAPQAATPVAPVPRVATTKPLLPIQPPQEPVKIHNKTIVFPTTLSGETSGKFYVSRDRVTICPDWSSFDER